MHPEYDQVTLDVMNLSVRQTGKTRQLGTTGVDIKVGGLLK